MAWSTPPTWTTGQLVTSTQLNILSADLNETAVGKAVTAGGYFVATNANAIAQRTIGFDSVTATETTSSTTFTNLATTGPAVVVVSGVRAMGITSATMSNSSTSNSARMAIEITGATSFSATDSLSLHITSSVQNDAYRASDVESYTMTAGTSTFTAKYRCSGGTASIGARRVIVLPY